MERPQCLPLAEIPTVDQAVEVGVYLLKLEIDLRRILSQKEIYLEIVGAEEPDTARKEIAHRVGRELSEFVGAVKTNDNELLISIIQARQSEFNLL